MVTKKQIEEIIKRHENFEDDVEKSEKESIKLSEIPNYAYRYGYTKSTLKVVLRELRKLTGEQVE